MKENAIENYLREQVARRGGIALKLDPSNAIGVPDRLVILPGAIVFVELKRPKGGRVAPMQQFWKDELRELGHKSEIVCTKEAVDELMRQYARGAYLAYS